MREGGGVFLAVRCGFRGSVASRRLSAVDLEGPVELKGRGNLPFGRQNARKPFERAHLGY